MFCSSCGAQIADDSVFCPECGAVQDGAKASRPAAAKATANKNAATPSVEQIFMDPDEKLLASLGNGYFVNLLFNRVKKCSALLSNKRVYLKGTMYAGDGRALFKLMEERTLDLEDITGTGFIYTRVSKIMIFLGILLELLMAILGGMDGELAMGILAGLIPCLILVIAAFFSRKIWFFIDYAGGKIQIDAKLIGLADVQDFHKQIRRAKDAIKAKEQ